MKPYPHKCPKCREKTFEPVNVSKVVSYRYDGRDYSLNVNSLPLLRCAQCGYRAHTNETEDRIIAELRKELDLLSPAEIQLQRLALRLTQKELARRICTSEESISRWESGLVIQSRAMNKLLQVYFFIPAVRECLGSAVFRKPSDLPEPVWGAAASHYRYKAIDSNFKFPIAGGIVRECA